MAESATTGDSLISDVKVEDIGPAAKRLTISISADAISEKLDDAIGALAAETALPGFRKGRAPRQLLERRFGSAVRSETRNQIVAEAYAAAIEEKQIKPVGDPEPVEKMDEIELEEGKPLTFAVDVEVMPEFELPGLDGVAVKKPIVELTDDHIGEELDRYKRQLGEASQLDEGWEEEDRVVGSIVATRKGEDEPFFTHDQVLVQVPGDEDGGRGQVLGLLVDGVKDKLKGTKVGDEITFETVGPEGHEREDIRGQDLVLQYTIRAGQRVVPASLEQVIETLGLPNEGILREQVKAALEDRLGEEQADAMRQQVCEWLLDSVDVALPEKLSDQQVVRSLEATRYDLLHRGMDPEEVETKLAELRAESEENALRRLKLFFVLRRLGDHFEVDVNQQELNGRVAAIAARRGLRPERLMQELQQSGRLNEVATQIREHKALDKVIETAKVTEISAEDWRKEMAAKSGGTTKKKTTKKKTSTASSKKKTTRKKTSTAKTTAAKD